MVDYALKKWKRTISREDAVKLGKRLNEARIIEHVSSRSQTFNTGTTGNILWRFNSDLKDDIARFLTQQQQQQKQQQQQSASTSVATEPVMTMPAAHPQLANV